MPYPLALVVEGRLEEWLVVRAKTLSQRREKRPAVVRGLLRPGGLEQLATSRGIGTSQILEQSEPRDLVPGLPHAHVGARRRVQPGPLVVLLGEPQAAHT